VVFHMSSGAIVTFNDPRRFGSMKLVARQKLDEEPLLKGLGPEPLGNAFDAGMLARACAGKKTSLKAALSDQKVVAGLGNIYVCEALYRAGLSPRRLAATVTGGRAARLATAIRDVLAEAIEAGGSSLRDYVQANGELGYFQHRWAVYGREGEPCPGCTCAEGVRRISQSGRSTFFCAKKQR
jgi:formamidopyrimidine-DNA glycosylase